MRKILALFLLICLIVPFAGCSEYKNTKILATTKPLHQFASAICKDTPLKVDLLVSENVSCLHDYTLQVSQMQMLESAELIIINGGGFEDFLGDGLLQNKNMIDTSVGINLHCSEDHDHDTHSHEQDPHTWLSIENAKKMAENIYIGLCRDYPQYADIFQGNFSALTAAFYDLEKQSACLSDLTHRQLITFHDGFGYMADSFGLEIIKAIEEESGSEASAHELIEIIEEIHVHNLPAIFIETSSSSSAASIISNETGVRIFELDMALSERPYFEAMQHNISVLKEALE